MSQKHQKSQARSISVNAIAEKPLLIWDYVAFAAIAVFCFLVFQQSDLLHTAGCSYGYLNGHFRDFYDYCGTFDIHPAYMPSFYLIFAIWNIPMRLFGVVTFPTENLPVLAILWAKLLPCLIYVASGVLIYHIAILAGMGSKKSKLCAYACLTMPVAFYAQFIFGQYDIIMTFCVLLGVYYYLKKKDIWFIFWFAIAMTFKYSALLIFAPLLLYREKNIWKIIASCVLLMVPFVLEFFVYRNSPVFQAYVFGFGGNAVSSPTGYIMNAGYYTGFELSTFHYEVSFAVLAFGTLCAWCYFNKPTDDRNFVNTVFYICCLAFFVLFGLSKWHPQWLLFAVPFWVISSFLHKDTKIFMILDLIFMLVYTIFNVQMIPNNVDQAMFNNGILRSFVNGNIGTELMMEDLIAKLDKSLCLSILTMMMLVYAVFKHPKYCAQNPAQEVNCMGWMRTRFIGGVAIFVVPAFVCLMAYFKAPYAGYKVENVYSQVQLCELGDEVSQTFCATGNSIDKIRFVAGVNDRVNKGYVKLTVKDSDDKILYEQDWETSGWLEDRIITANLNGVPTTPGEYYTAVFEVTQANGDYAVSIYRSEDNVTGDKKEIAEADGKKQSYQLEMIVYQ